ncbi:MAG: RecX family transcriptional regulator [Cyclobacteriaceae bacterium]|nr:RecX family transcriptional regulator [Cyclobacteriaceae bacterium]MDW8330371.1 regulatory protein RecX [Cyclobacteriaceae bacterium]
MKSPDADIEQIRKKIYRYCAYQERSHEEVKNKLYELGLGSSQVNRLLTELIETGFLNEERFARAFAGGKFRLKKWGRLKIIRELEKHRLTPACIRLGLQEIDEESYRKTLNELLVKHLDTLRHRVSNIFQLRDRLSRFLIQKGYEPELVWEEIKKALPE